MELAEQVYLPLSHTGTTLRVRDTVFNVSETMLIGRNPGGAAMVPGLDEELWRVSLSLPDLPAWTVNDFRRGIQGALVSLAVRAFEQAAVVNMVEPWIHTLMIRVKALHGGPVGPLGEEPPAGALGGNWSSYATNIHNVNGRPGIRLADIMPFGMPWVPLHDELEDAWRNLHNQYQTGSDPDVNDLDMRSVLLYLRVHIFPRQQNPLARPHPRVYVLPLQPVRQGNIASLNVVPRVVGSEAVVISAQQHGLVNNVPLVIRPWMPAGGCKSTILELMQESAQRQTEAIAPSRGVKGNSLGVMMDLHNLKVWCPHSKRNNCFFACVKYVLSKESTKPDWFDQRIEKWRKELHVPASALIDVGHIQQFVTLKLKRTVYIFDEKLKEVAVLKPDLPSVEAPLELVLFREHYFVLCSKTLQRYVCELCGKRNVIDMEVHRSSRSCSVKRQNYFQLKKARCIRAMNPVELQSVPPAGMEWRNMVFYDFETFFDGVKHNVYAVGGMWWDHAGEEEYFSFYGETALECFMLFLQEMYESGQKLVLVSYNGSGFDHYMLLEQHLKYATPLDSFLMNRGRLLQLDFWGHKVVDLFNFLGPASLDYNCQAYGIPIRKSVFPHLFAKSWEDVYYVGPLLGLEHYPEKMRDEAKVWQAQSTSQVFNFEKECEFYLKRDVECLTELGRQFFKTVWDEFHLYLPNYITLSQMAYDLWRGTLPAEWRLPLPVDPAFYDAVNASTYGGRCHFVKRFFRSSQSDTTPYADITDYLVDLDVVSLYPASMQGYPFPEGDFELWEDDRSVQTFQDMFDHHALLPLSIWEVSVRPPKHLLIPALPRKNHEGNTVWDVEDSDCQWYTSVDIATGRELGYDFTFRKGYVWKQTQPVFREYIHSVFAKKAEQDVYKSSKDARYNPAARDVYKKLMNALYGKMMQKRQSVNHLFLTKQDDEDHANWSEFLEKHGGVEYTELGEGVVLMTGERLDFAETVSKPHYLGAFVLSYSRQIMNEYFSLLDPIRVYPDQGTWKESADNSMFYTDTDSLIVHAKDVEKVKGRMGSALGQLADELSGGKILEGYFLAPKLYGVKYMLPDGSIKVKLRGKGIPNSLLSLDQFRQMLFDNEPVKYEFTQLRKLQTELNRKQEEAGMQPFTVISLLGASRTLNKDHTYSQPGVLGGRVVLKDVTYSWPLGFEPFQQDLWDLVMADEEQEVVRPARVTSPVPPLSPIEGLDELLAN